MSRVAATLSTGLVLGAAWGALEALWVLLRTWLPLWAALGRPPPLPDAADWAAAVLLGAVRYAALVVPLLALGTFVVALLLGRRGERQWLAPRLGLAGVVFANLYWHSKTWWAFNWGEPWHSPKRLLLALGWALLAWCAGSCLVRPGWLGVPGRRATWAAALVLAAGGGWALLRERALVHATPVAPPTGAPNVLFVVVDALRADRLGCYGYTRRVPPTSPRVDELAAEGVVFERAFAQAPFTWTSFGSFLTGKYPREHGLIRMTPEQRLDTHQNRTVAAALSEAGYATGAFLTGTLSNSTGLLDGFDTYFETIVGHEPVNRHSKWSVVRSRMLLTILWNKVRQALDDRLVNTEAQRWIRAQAGRPFFALVHYYSTHTPYDPPAPLDRLYDPDYEGRFHPFTQSWAVEIMKHLRDDSPCVARLVAEERCPHFDVRRDVEHVNALYDAGVLLADQMFGELLDLLDELGIADETLVVFTSDHGEELFDHGVFEHDWMFETNLRVPLVLRLPGGLGGGVRVEWPVELRDLPATILDVAGVGRLAERAGGTTPGRSLLPDVAGVHPGPDETWVFAENVRYVSMMDARYKITRNRFRSESLRVFDLAACPGEHRPLERTDPAVLPLLAGLLERMAVYEASQPASPQRASFPVSEELTQLLGTLGYLDSAETQVFRSAGVDLSDLANSRFLGSNETLEEELYTRVFRWPPPAETGCY